MKLLLENWRKYLTEDCPQYDFEKQLLEEGKIWDFIKDSATAAAKLKEKIAEEISQKVEEQSDEAKKLEEAAKAINESPAKRGKPKKAVAKIFNIRSDFFN